MALAGSALSTSHSQALLTSLFLTASVTPTTTVVFAAINFPLNTPGDGTVVSSVTGLGGTWTLIDRQLANNGNQRLEAWVGVGCSGSGVLTFNFSAGGVLVASNVGWAIFEFTGNTGLDGAVGVNIVTPIITSNTKVNDGPVATSVVTTPNTLQTPSNVFVVCVQHQTAEDVTPSQGTEGADDNSGHNRGIEWNYKVNWTSGSMGGSWTTSSQRKLVGWEVNAASESFISWLTEE